MNDANQCTANTNERPHAERTAMFNSVEKLIAKIVCEQSARLMPFMDRDDVLQECLLEIWTVAGRTDKYDATKSRWTTYVGACVRRKLAALYDSHTRRKIHTVPEASSATEYPALADDDVPLVGQCDADEVATEAGNAALTALANPDANPLKPIFEALYPSEVPIFMLVAVEGLSAVQAAEQLGWKLSIVEIAIRTIVKRLQDRGLLSAELLEKYRRWKEKDALNPARGVDPKTKESTAMIREKRKAKGAAWREKCQQQRLASEERKRQHAAGVANRKAQRAAAAAQREADRRANTERKKQPAHADA